LNYFLEAAWQEAHSQEGVLPTRGGGGLAGVSYYTKAVPLTRSAKVDVRGAAYQGDDPATEDVVEQFAPTYRAFAWGDRSGAVGPYGDETPLQGGNPDGLLIGYLRVWIRPVGLPLLRLQAQVAHEREWVDSDGVDLTNDEVQVRAYYDVSANHRIQLRYGHVWPNDVDQDLQGAGEDGYGEIDSEEDRTVGERMMLEWLGQF
jgi:hypothetical protein